MAQKRKINFPMEFCAESKRCRMSVFQWYFPKKKKSNANLTWSFVFELYLLIATHLNGNLCYNAYTFVRTFRINMCSRHNYGVSKWIPLLVRSRNIPWNICTRFGCFFYVWHVTALEFKWIKRSDMQQIFYSPTTK